MNNTRSILALGLAVLMLIGLVVFLSIDLGDDGRDGVGRASPELPVQAESGEFEAVRAPDPEIQRSERQVAEEQELAEPPAKDIEDVRLFGEVRVEDTGQPVSSGTVELEFLRRRLEDSDGRVLNELELATLTLQDLDWERQLDLAEAAKAEIGADGRFEIQLPKGCTPTSYRVEPADEVDGPRIGMVDEYLMSGFLETEGDLRLEVLEGERRLDLEVKGGLYVDATVVDDVTGLGVSGALLIVHKGWGFEDWAANTDPLGKGHVAGIDPEEVLNRHWTRWRLTAMHEGYVGTTAEFPFDPEEPGLEGIELRITRGTVVAGRVVDSKGEGVAGAYLQLVIHEAESLPLMSEGMAASPHSYSDCISARSKDDGAFQFPAVLASGSGELRAGKRHARFVDAESLQLDLSRDQENLLVHLELATQLRVRAVYADGSSPASKEFRILLHHPERGWHDSLFFDEDSLIMSAARGESYDVHAFAPSPNPETDSRDYRGRRRLLVPLEEVEDEVFTVTLEPYEPVDPLGFVEGASFSSFNTKAFYMHRLVLTFKDAESGRVLEKASIRVNFGSMGQLGGQLTERGQFAIGLPPKPRTITLEVEGFKKRVLDLDPGLGPSSTLEVSMTSTD